MLYYIMAVSEEEYAAASKDSDYAPKEYLVGELHAPDERAARQLLRRGIAAGEYPAGSALTEGVSVPSFVETR